jgi:hypothetical protein
MTTLNRLLLSATLAATSASGYAMSQNQLDVRLGVGEVPGISKWEYNSFSASVDPKTSFGIQPTVLWVRRFDDQWGMIAGGGIFIRQHKGELNGESGKYAASGIDLQAGVSFNGISKLEIEAAPMIDFGIGKSDTDFGAGVTLSNGSYSAIGIRVGAIYALTDNFWVGADLGYMSGTGKTKLESGGWSDTEKMTFSGAFFGITGVYRFNR